MAPFTEERLQSIAQNERSHFWYVTRRNLIDDLLDAHAAPSSRLVDVGCGTGSFAESARERGFDVVGVDMHALLIRSRFARVCADVACLPLRTAIADVVTVFDVLEHADDTAMIAEIARVLRPHGRVFVTVPAFPFLWSYRDEAAGHLRRYRRRDLQALLERTGLRPFVMGYAHFFSFPLLAVSRILRNSRAGRDLEDVPPSWLNSLLLRGGALESRIRRRAGLPIGSSLYAVAEKR